MSEKDVFYIKLAGLTVEMHSKTAFAKERCKDYLVEYIGAPDLVADATQEDVEREKKQSATAITDGYCEDICLYRSIAEQLPSFDGAVFHGASVSAGGKGYIFTAPSGTGKTTHIKLWLEHFRDQVDIINGDKPIIRLFDGQPTVCSTPWAGKEGMQKNRQAPLGAICLIKQAKENKIRRIAPREYFETLIKQLYLPRDRVALLKTFDIVDLVLKNVPIYLLECNISKEAAELSFKTLVEE